MNLLVLANGKLIEYRITVVQQASRRAETGSVDQIGPSDGASIKSSICIHPASPLERSAEFFPETYTTDDIRPTMFCYYSHMVANLENIRVNECNLFYRRSHREWLRLTARITITVESKYWNLEHVAPNRSVANGLFGLPLRIVSMLTTFVRNHDEIQQDMRIAMLLGRDHQLALSNADPGDTIRILIPEFDAGQYLAKLTHQTRHWIMPRYNEKHLDHRPTHMHQFNENFLVYLDSKWVLERRFGSDKAQIDSIFHHMTVLHHAGSGPGVARFLGVAIDHYTGHLKGVLTDIQSKGRLSRVLDSCEVSMERRLKWSRQLVQGVANIHSSGLTVGKLGSFTDCGVAIDCCDDLKLNWFRPDFHSSGPGTLPPEYRVSGGAGCKALPETDLYQMGFVLWRILVGQTSSTLRAFCDIAGCSSDCDRPHAMSKIPFYRDEQPEKYLMDIIAECRAEDPALRSPAYILLQRFPQSDSLLDDDSNPATLKNERKEENLSLDECTALMGLLITCDRCGKFTAEHGFTCKICNLGDYDICPECLHSRGLHCLDKTHCLKEFYIGMKEQKYYTSVQADGKRKVIVE